MAGLDTVDAGTVSAQLGVTARVVSSCRIRLSTDGFPDPGQFHGGPNDRGHVLLTSDCSQHPGSANTMTVTTESRHGSEPKVEILSRAAAAGQGDSPAEAIDEIGRPDRKITRWGVVPTDSHLKVSMSAPSGTGKPLLGNDRERIVTLIIDY